jgi:hypothetical protein
VLPAFTGIAVHDRYINYDHADLAKQLAGHQLCAAHLLRDVASAAESHPEHRWPDQAARALRGLIHAANTARDSGRSAVPADIADPLILELRRAVRVGLAQIPRIPGPASKTKPNNRRAPAARMLPRPRPRRPAVHHRHPGLAHEQHLRTRPATRENTAENLRTPPIRGHHPRPAHHPQLHQHRRETRHQRHDRPPRVRRRLPCRRTRR